MATIHVNYSKEQFLRLYSFSFHKDKVIILQWLSLWKGYASFVASLILAHSTCFLNWKSHNNWPGAAPLRRRLWPTPRCPIPFPVWPFAISVYQSGLRLLLLWKWKVTLLWSGWTTLPPNLRLTPRPSTPLSTALFLSQIALMSLVSPAVGH